jgi:putative MATE family efflux protein
VTSTGLESDAAAPRIDREAIDGAFDAMTGAEDVVATVPSEIRRADLLLTGPVRHAVFWLALPIFGEQLLNAAIAWNDTYLAGRVSAAATGAVGFASYVSWLMTMLFGLVGIGATAIVARAVGAKNPREALHATNQAMTLSVLLGLAGTFGVAAVAPLFAHLLNMRGHAADAAIHYLRVESLGLIGAAVSLSMAACLRGAGDARTPLKILGGVNVVNMALSWVLAFGVGPWPGMGLVGIAWGTVIARWLGALGFIAVMQRRDHVLRLCAFDMRPDRPLIKRMLRVGVPAAVDGALMFSGHFVFMAIVSRVPGAFSPEVVYAAHVVGIRIESLSYLPASAFMFAASTLVGQNIGAGQMARAHRCAHESTRQASCFLLAVGLVLYFGAEEMFRLLSNNEQVWAAGVPALRALAFFQLTLAPLIVYTGALRGAGDTRVPIAITLAGLLLMRIPVALFGGFVLQWGLLGAWLGMFADLTVRAGLLTWRFVSGAWERIKV